MNETKDIDLILKIIRDGKTNEAIVSLLKLENHLSADSVKQLNILSARLSRYENEYRSGFRVDDRELNEINSILIDLIRTSKTDLNKSNKSLNKSNTLKVLSLLFLISIIGIYYFNKISFQKSSQHLEINNDFSLKKDSIDISEVLDNPNNKEKSSNKEPAFKSQISKNEDLSSNLNDSVFLSDSNKRTIMKEYIIVLDKKHENSRLFVNNREYRSSGIFRSVFTATTQKIIDLKLLSNHDTCYKIVNLTNIKNRIVFQCSQ